MSAAISPEWVAPYFGKPFGAGGRGPDAYDCWGLVLAVYNDMGVTLPDYGAGIDDVYAVRRTGPAMDAAKDDWVKIDAPQERDVVLLRRGRLPVHVGLWVRPGVMFHVEDDCHACFERLDNLLWKNKIVGFYTWPK